MKDLPPLWVGQARHCVSLEMTVGVFGFVLSVDGGIRVIVYWYSQIVLGLRVERL